MAMNYSQKIQKIMDDHELSMEEMAVTLNVTVRTLNDFVKKEYPREPAGAMARLIDILVGEINPLNVQVDPETIETRYQYCNLIYTIYKNGNLTIQIDGVKDPEGIITPKSRLTDIHPFINLWKSKNDEYTFEKFKICVLDFFESPIKWVITQVNIEGNIQIL